MKKIYTILCIIVLSILLTSHTNAQCACSNGDPVDSVVQVQALSGILPFSTIVPFNKLDPSVGILSCVVSRTTVTTILDIDLVNRDVTDRVTYLLDYTRTTSLSGPGHTVNSSTARKYGPYDLGQAGVDPDTAIHIGPDTIFNSRILTRQTTTSLSSYIGTGTVNFTYTNTAIFGFLIGNDNNGLDVAAISDVNIKLVYYFCPLMVLSNGMRNFSVSRNGSSVDVKWITEDEQPGNRYILETSKNGKDFTPIANISGFGNGKQEYKYSHPVSNPGQGKMYFRVKQVVSNGRGSYSQVRYISFGENGDLQPAIFPNPVDAQVMVRFATPQTGNVMAEIISMNGQVLQKRQVTGSRLTGMELTLNRKYPSGTYWLRVRNLETGAQATERIYVQ
jgi:hypothetical protein